jgi:hypothetical protein
MAKKIDTASAVKVKLRSRTVTVQEFSYFGAIKAIGVIRKILTKVREFGSVDDLFKGLLDSTEEDGKQTLNTDKLLKVLEVLMSVVGDDSDMLASLMILSVVDEGKKFTIDDVDQLLPDEAIDVFKAIYEVNWVQGSLKNVFEKLGLKKEAAQPTISNASQTTPNAPSQMPVNS